MFVNYLKAEKKVNFMPKFKNLIFFFLFLLLLTNNCPPISAKTSADNPISTIKKKSNPSIPLVAHFCYGLWDDAPLPAYFQQTMMLWEMQKWTVRLWDREQVDKLLAKYPALQALCATLSRKVQKADLARLLIVYENGGYYFDLDCQPMNISLLNELRKKHPEATANFFVECNINPTFANETKSYPIRKGQPEHLERIANFAFGATPKHPLIWEILELAQLRCIAYPTFNSDYDILYKTGPDCVTECIYRERRFYDESQLWITDHHFFMKHTCAGSWRKNKDLRDPQ